MGTIKVTFTVKSSRPDSKNQCPILCRLSKGSERLEFYTSYKCSKEAWNASTIEVNPKKDERADFKNSSLVFIRTRLESIIMDFQYRREDLSLKRLRSIYQGYEKPEHTVLEAFDAYIENLNRKVGKGVKKITVTKYRGIRKHLVSFIEHEYKSEDYLLSSLKTLFLRKFQSYLTTVKGLNPLTVNKITGRVQTVIRYSLENEWIDKFPFYGFKNIKYKKKIIFLSQEDLDKLREYQFAQERLQQVCDGFIFCCYTGLAYAEFKALRSKHLELYKDKWWISMVREKTQEPYYVPLLDQAKELILKYSKVENISSLTPDKVLIPCLSNQKMNSYLKEIGDIVGISNVLKTHLARKTFASTVLLSNGVPMHVTSRLLNHSSVTVTEGYYGVLVRDKLLEEIKKVENELKKIKS